MSRAALDAFLVTYSDSTFTNPHQVVRSDEPADCRGDFTHMGAKFWGFETDRHRGHRVDAGIGNDASASIRFDHDAHHELVIGLHAPATVDEVRVSTKWFTGNQVRAISVDLRLADASADAAWITVLEREPLAPDAEHAFSIEPTAATECRVRCYQEGGISRINLFGAALPAPAPRANLLTDARISRTSNEHYGNPAMAVAGVREQDHMIGWESARTGFGERALFSLGQPTRIGEFIVDTYLHRLNPPLTCHLYGLPPAADPDAAWPLRPRWQLRFDDGVVCTPDDFQAYMLEARYLNEAVANPRRFDVSLALPDESPWLPLAPFTALRPDSWHRITVDPAHPEVEHLLFMFYPNGGIHGLAAYAAS